MLIKYVLRREDLIISLKRELKANHLLFKNYVFVIAIILDLIYSYYHPAMQDNKQLNDIGSWIVVITLNISFSIGIIFLIRYLYIVKMGNNIWENPSLTGERSLEFIADKIVIYSSNSKSEINISSVKRISESTKHFFIYLDKDISIVIPKRSQGSDDLVHQIAETAKINVC